MVKITAKHPLPPPNTGTTMLDGFQYHTVFQ